MPRGGRRVGAGRPRLLRATEWPGQAPNRPAPTADELDALAEPPTDLPGALQLPALAGANLTSQADFWRRYAPQAIAQRTLVPATVAGFRELCELAAFKEELAARLQKFGSDGKAGSDRLRNYTRLSQRLDAALGRFKLTAFGKPADGGGPRRPPANPFSQVGGGG